MFPDLSKKSVLITGGGSGIGATLTEGFLAQGAKVAIAQRSDANTFCDRLEETYGSRPLFIAADLSEVQSTNDVVRQAAKCQGGIDILVNNAANDARHETESVSEDFWEEMLSINLKAYFFACQAVIHLCEKLTLVQSSTLHPLAI